MDFGFTNDIERLNAAIAWREAAVADGWSIRPTYGSEGVDRAASLAHPDGFVASVLARTHNPGERWKYEANISVWGPDKLAVRPPSIYDMTAIRAGVERCHYCNVTGIKTERVGFAGRACAKCAPVEEAKLGPRYYD